MKYIQIKMTGRVLVVAMDPYSSFTSSIRTPKVPRLAHICANRNLSDALLKT